MKKIPYIIFTLLLAAGLWGCSGAPAASPVQTMAPDIVYTEAPAPQLPADEQVEQTIDALLSDLDGAGGEARKEQVRTALDTLYADGLLEEPAVYSEEEALFTFVYDDGVRGGVSLREMDDETDGAVRGSGKSPAPYTSSFTGQELSVLILNGFEDTAFRTSYYNGLYSDWSGMGLGVTLDNDVTVDDLTQLAPYDVIVFSMHGGTYLGEPIMSLDQEVTEENDRKYERHLRNDLSVAKVYCTDGSWHYWVMGHFFSNNYSSGALDGKVIYVQCCSFYGCRCYTSVPDTSFADCFLELSAETVFGYYNSVLSTYGRNVMRTTLEGMFEGATASEALLGAMALHGENDGYEDAADDKYIAHPQLTGDPYAVVIRQGGTLADGSYNGTLSAGSFYMVGNQLWAEVELTGYVILTADQADSLAPGSVISLSALGLPDITISKIVRYRQENYIELNDQDYLLQPYYNTDSWILTYPYNDLPVTYTASVENAPIASDAQIVDDTMLMLTPLSDPRDFFSDIYAADSWPCAITVEGGEITRILFEYRP